MTDKVYTLIEEAGRVHNELVKEFERVADQCYMEGDLNMFWYWINRANTIRCDNYRLVEDLNKLVRIDGPKET